MTIPGYNAFIKNARKYGFSLYGIPKSGQITEYADGDDGHYKKGYPKIGARFTDNGDGTITDNATGLMWVKNPTLTKMTWLNALAYCEALNYAGHDDWRLANADELLSLIDYGRNAPAIDTNFFPNPGSDWYWTATTYHGATAQAVIINMWSPGLSNNTKTYTQHVWPVRLGE